MSNQLQFSLSFSLLINCQTASLFFFLSINGHDRQTRPHLLTPTVLYTGRVLKPPQLFFVTHTHTHTPTKREHNNRTGGGHRRANSCRHMYRLIVFQRATIMFVLLSRFSSLDSVIADIRGTTRDGGGGLYRHNVCIGLYSV
jgi:hypothetical protein